MSELEILATEIRELKNEIHQLEQDEENGDRRQIKIADVGVMDDLLYDILNDDGAETDAGCGYDLVDGQRILRSAELKELHEKYIQKIQTENVFRFNAVTMFPVSNDEHSEFLGIRFDVYNAFERKFTQTHYIILKQQAIEPPSKQGLMPDPAHFKWVLFQTTIPKYISVGEIYHRYLMDCTHTLGLGGKSPSGGSAASSGLEIPSFYRINKFSMRVYQELTRFESRHATFARFQQHFRNTGVCATFEPSCATLKIDVAKAAVISVDARRCTATVSTVRNTELGQTLENTCRGGSLLKDLDQLVGYLQATLDSLAIENR